MASEDSGSDSNQSFLLIVRTGRIFTASIARDEYRRILGVSSK
jgi:hypothetical protein